MNGRTTNVDFSRVPAISIGSGFQSTGGIVGPAIGGTIGGLVGEIIKDVGIPALRDWLQAPGGNGAISAREKAGYPGDFVGPLPCGKKYRRMNVLNAKALRRSMRRVEGFSKFARKTISFTKRVKIKKRRRS